MYVINSQYINQALATFYNLIQNKPLGAPDTRYRSWEWCYDAFGKARTQYRNAATDAERDKIVDDLALHLGFYLASWGMYRGSSYLLQREYKAHIPTVKILLEAQYDFLFGYDVQPQVFTQPKSFAKSSANLAILLNGNVNGASEGLYWRIKDAYNGYVRVNEDDPSDTLITKILMGALGCIPAFDRFLKNGIKWLKANYPDYKDISQTISSKKRNQGKTFFMLELFASANYSDLTQHGFVTTGGNNSYPIMKYVDMFLWQVGYELDIMDHLNNSKTAEKNKQKLKDAVVGLGICDVNDSYQEVVRKIKVRWGIN